MLSVMKQQFLETQDLSDGYIHALQYGLENGLDVEDIEPYIPIIPYITKETILMIFSILIQYKIKL